MKHLDKDILLTENIIDAEIVDDNTNNAKAIYMVDTGDGFSASVEPLSNNILLDDKEKNHVHDTSIVKVYERSIVTSTGLTLSGQRLLRVVLSLITPQDKPGKRYSFYVEDYRKLFNIAEYPKETLRTAAKELLVPHTYNQSDDGEDFSISGLITQITVKSGIATFSIADDLLPVYQSLREKNEYLLGYTREFSCSYSFAFYELFLEMLGNNKDNPNSVNIYYTLEKLQSWLKLGNKYIDPRTGRLSYASFKRKVLVPVMNDINRTTEQGPYCNINIEIREEKSGRRVVGVEFTIWRTSSIIKDQPIVNKFYLLLSPDVKLAYDNLIALDIKQSEIENCIIRNKEKGFLNIYHYIAKQKYQGRAYVSSILRNDVTEFEPERIMNIKNIHRAYTISDAEQKRYDELEKVLRSFSKTDKIVVNSIVKKYLLNDEPYIYKHLDSMSIDEILDTKDLKIFFLEMFIHVLLDIKDKDITKIYQAHFEGKEKQGILAAASTKITDIFKQYGINKNVWPTLMNYPEDYILANVNYCVKKYKNEKGWEEIAGAIVKAIKQDFAGFNVSKKEAELEKLKKEAQNNVDQMMRSLFAPLDESVPEEKSNEPDSLINEVQKEVPKKNVDKSAEDVIEEAYNMFIKTGSFSDKDRLKMKAIEHMNDFQKTVICGILPTDNKIRPEELSNVPIDLLLKTALFEKAYKKVFVEELEF